LRQPSGKLAVVLGRGDGRFEAELVLSGGVRPQTDVTFLVGDFNGDGNPDLIDFPPEIHPYLDFLPGKGDGTFGDVVRRDLGTTPAAGTMSAVAISIKMGSSTLWRETPSTWDTAMERFEPLCFLALPHLVAAMPSGWDR
jgi:hypothetical protein